MVSDIQIAMGNWDLDCVLIMDFGKQNEFDRIPFVQRV